MRKEICHAEPRVGEFPGNMGLSIEMGPCFLVVCVVACDYDVSCAFVCLFVFLFGFPIARFCVICSVCLLVYCLLIVNVCSVCRFGVRCAFASLRVSFLCFCCFADLLTLSFVCHVRAELQNL